MDINTTQETLCINKIVGEKKEIIFVEGDMIVPDIKPDILNTISTTGNVCIYKKEVLDGKVRIDGCINVYVIYLADNDIELTRGINTDLDFTGILDFDNCRANMPLDANVVIKSIECKVLNGRKISIKASLEIDGKIYSNENVSIVKEINDVPNIQSLTREFTNKLFSRRRSL